jgi:hypothetical protein
VLGVMVTAIAGATLKDNDNNTPITNTDNKSHENKNKWLDLDRLVDRFHREDEGREDKEEDLIYAPKQEKIITRD